jgi:hypothetical protein
MQYSLVPFPLCDKILCADRRFFTCFTSFSRLKVAFVPFKGRGKVCVLDPWSIVFEEYFEPNVVLPLCAGYLKEWCFTYHTRLWFFLTVLCDPFCGLQK